MNEDGFFVEAHAKLGPSEFATDGVFLCGMAHYPKPIDESVARRRLPLQGCDLAGQRKSEGQRHGRLCESRVLQQLRGVRGGLPLLGSVFCRERTVRGKSGGEPVLCKGCGSALRHAGPGH